MSRKTAEINFIFENKGKLYYLDTTTGSPVNVNRRFGWKYHLHL